MQEKDAKEMRMQEEHGMHTHVHKDGTVHEDENAYTHVHEDGTTHIHVHPNAKAVSNRLARAIGHLEKVKAMVDNGEDCAQVLMQLSAVRSAINNAGKIILMDHLNHCIVDAMEDGDMQKIEEFGEAIKSFVK